jgi:hypothetical protein
MGGRTWKWEGMKRRRNVLLCGEQKTTLIGEQAGAVVSIGNVAKGGVE